MSQPLRIFPEHDFEGGNPVASPNQRAMALARYEILDTAPEAEFTSIAQLAGAICKAPLMAISFLEHDRQWFKARLGLDVSETPIGQSFCKLASESNDVFVVEDALSDKRFSENPLVRGPPNIRFYAGMRIRAGDGTPIGALCVLDNEARPGGITPVEHASLQTLARQVETLLELRRALLEQKKQLNVTEGLAKQLRYVANHDGLTGLLRREAFHTCLAATLLRRNGSAGVAVALIDIDHFKQLNDAHGHDAGDRLLQNFTARLGKVLRPSDIVARLGGDEFAVIIDDVECSSSLATMLGSISRRLNQPFFHDGRTIQCQASIGLSFYPDHASTPSSLLKCSDLALAEAKKERGRAVIFDPTFAVKYDLEAEMLEIARVGLRDERILPFYQPKIDLHSGRVIGFEALVRCVQQRGPPLLPESFQHAFVDQETARSIGKVVMRRVLDDVEIWTRNGIDFGSVAINTCAADFQDNEFAERLIGSMSERKISPHKIEIEVTEGVFLGRGAEYVARALEIISSHGVQIALDDFGTGYASLSHLKQFPVNVIKIDGSFVVGIGKCADDNTIVKTLIQLGQSLGIGIIAEGLETENQINFVREAGCRLGQGFYFSEAISPELVPNFIHKWSANCERGF